MSSPTLESMMSSSGRVDTDEMTRLARELDERKFESLVRVPVLLGGLITGEHESLPEGSDDTLDNRLLIYPLLNTERGWTVARERFDLGSDSNCGMVLPDPSIAPRHVRFTRHGMALHAQSMAPQQVMRVNGEDFGTELVDVHDGDHIQVGRYRFIVLNALSLQAYLIEDRTFSDHEHATGGTSGAPTVKKGQAGDKSSEALGETPEEWPTDPEEMMRLDLLYENIEGLLSGDPEKVYKVIDKQTLFNPMSGYEKRRISCLNSYIMRYHPGEMVIEEGSEASSFHILLKGSVTVLKQGCDTPLAKLKLGQFFGEVAFLDNRLRITSVVADDGAVTLLISRNLMRRLGVVIREKFKDGIIQRFLERVSDQNMELADYFSSLLYDGPAWHGIEDIDAKVKPKEQLNLPSVIDKLNFFEAFSDHERQRIQSEFSVILRYRRGENIVEEGEEGNAFYLILEGWACVLKTRKDQQVLLKDLYPDDLFGEIAFLTKQKRTSSVVAYEDTTVFRVDERLLVQMGVDTREKIKDCIIRHLIRRLEENNASITEYRNLKAKNSSGNRTRTQLRMD